MQGLELEIPDDDGHCENEPLLGGGHSGYGSSQSISSSARAERWPLAKNCAPASACKGLIGYTACIFLAAGIVATSALWPSHSGSLILGLAATQHSSSSDIVDGGTGDGSSLPSSSSYEPVVASAEFGSAHTPSGSEQSFDRSKAYSTDSFPRSTVALPVASSSSSSYSTSRGTTTTTAGSSLSSTTTAGSSSSSSTTSDSLTHTPSAQPSRSPSKSPSHAPTTATPAPTTPSAAASSTSALLFYGAIAFGVALSLALGAALAFSGWCDDSNFKRKKHNAPSSSSSSSSSPSSSSLPSSSSSSSSRNRPPVQPNVAPPSTQPAPSSTGRAPSHLPQHTRPQAKSTHNTAPTPHPSQTQEESVQQQQQQQQDEVALFVGDFNRKAQDGAKENLAKLQAFLKSASLAHTYDPLVEFGVESVSDFTNPLLVNESALRSGLGLAASDIDRMLLVQAAAMKGQPMPPIAIASAAISSNPTSTSSSNSSSTTTTSSTSTETLQSAPLSAPSKVVGDSNKPAAAGARSTRASEIAGVGVAEDNSSAAATALESEPSSLSNESTRAEAPTLASSSSSSFAVGDLVTWKGSDEDVPSGTEGTVTAVYPDGDVEVSFPRQQPPSSSASSAQSQKGKKKFFSLSGHKKPSKKDNPAPGDAELPLVFTFAQDRLEHAAS